MKGPAMALFWAQAKKAQERKLICKRKRDARRRFQAYVRRRGVVTQLFVLLLTRNFLPLVPGVRKIWAKLRAATFWQETCQGWSGLWIFSYRAISHHFKEGHKLSQSNICSPATCGNFVPACRYRVLPYDCKPFYNWEIHGLRNRCSGMQCDRSSCSVSIFFRNILVWIYWSWAFFKWQRPSAPSQHLWQVQQQVLNLYMLNYLNLHLEWHKMLLNMVINIQQNIADWF